MKNPQLIEFLKQRVGLCQHFADERLDQLVKESRVISYEPNEAVVEFGEDAAFLGVLLEGDQHFKRRVNELEIVSCHLGNGASLCAVDHGRPVDTSMGFTPVEGLIMGTRCGDLDPGAIAYLQREAGLDGAQVEELLNKRSGLLGLSGISSDMREVERAADASAANLKTGAQVYIAGMQSED